MLRHQLIPNLTQRNMNQTYFDVLLTVHYSNGQFLFQLMHHNFTLLTKSLYITCFGHLRAHLQEDRLYIHRNWFKFISHDDCISGRFVKDFVPLPGAAGIWKFSASYHYHALPDLRNLEFVPLPRSAWRHNIKASSLRQDESPKRGDVSQQIAAWQLLYRVQHPARYLSRLQTIPSPDIE